MVVEVVEMEGMGMNKTSVKGEGKGSRIENQEGGPTKLPGEGGGHQERPGKEEPLVGWEEGRNQQPPTQLEPVLGGVNSPSVVAPPRMMAGCARQSHLLVGFAKQGGARRVEGGGTPVQTTSRRGPTCSHSSTSPGRSPKFSKIPGS